MSMKSLIILLLSLSAFGALHTLAQVADEDATPTTTEEDATGGEPPEENAAEPSDPDVPVSEVFIPSEEISEDFAVSFPVDI